jgi:hypothetical protein
MNRRIAAVLIALLGCAGCISEFETADSSAPAGYPSSGSSTDDDTTDDDQGTFWQLPDDAMFNVTFAPWPPQAGDATLKVEVTENDWEQKFTGKLEYRLAQTQESETAWTELVPASEDEYGSKLFETPVTLSDGSAFVQFRLHYPDQPQPLELNDWEINVGQ